MCCNTRTSKEILNSPHLKVPLLKDIKYCLTDVQRIDPDFLRLAYHFSRFVLGLKRGGEVYATERKHIQELIVRRAT